MCWPVICIAGLVIGKTFHLAAYMFTGLSSINGSDSNTGCPLVCKMTGASYEGFCDCTGQFYSELSLMELFLHDVSQRGIWASQLYTVDATTTSYAIGFRFSTSFMLQKVELSIFLCIPWSIPRSGLTINIHRDIVFPGFTSTTPIGSRTLTLQPNCVSLETIYITTSPTSNGNIYFIEFTNSVTVGGIYIGEVIFRDHVIQNQACRSTGVSNFLVLTYLHDY